MAKQSGYEWLGTVYLKFPSIMDVVNDGGEDNVWLKAFPAYVQPEEIWMSTKIIGQAADGIDPVQVTPYYMRGAGKSVSSQDIWSGSTAIAVWANLFTQRDIEAFEPDAVASTDVGILGDSQRTEDFRSTFFERKADLGLPGKAVFSNANKILQVDEFKVHKRLGRRYFDIQENKFMGVGIAQDEIATQTDDFVMMWGDTDASGDDSFKDLHKSIMDELLEGGGELTLTLGTEVDQWMQKGKTLSNTGDTLRVFMRTTIKCNVYVPSALRHLTVK